jgi:hypothetical protein
VTKPNCQSRAHGKLTRYAKPQCKRKYVYRFELPALWFQYLQLNLDRYKVQLDTAKKQIIISVPTQAELEKFYKDEADAYAKRHGTAETEEAV